MSNYEKNTDLFYEELNGECNPDTLLNIARNGIFLYEPLFNNNKLKYHENTIEISILAGQYFMIFNRKQYQKMVDLSYIEECIMYPYLRRSYNICDLVVVNKYLIDQLMIEENEKILISITNNCWYVYLMLLYIYKHKYISTKIFHLYSYTFNDMIYNLKFELFEYFYFENCELLNNTIKNNNNLYKKCRFLEYILHNYARDVKIFKYCINKIKKYKIIHCTDYRVPLFFPLTFIEKYKDEFYIPNQLYITCDDKQLQKFINITFSNYYIKQLKDNGCRSKEKKEYYLKKYDIDMNKLNNFEITSKNLNFDYIYNSENYKKFLKDMEKSDSIRYDTRNNLIKFVNTTNEKYKYYKLKNIFIKKSFNNLYFVKKYLNDINEIEKILEDPEYLLKQKIEICQNELFVMLLCCIISMVHNNYNSFIIKTLLYTSYSERYFDYINKKIIFYEDSCDISHVKKIIKLLRSTPHKIFNSYILVDYCKPW